MNEHDTSHRHRPYVRWINGADGVTHDPTLRNDRATRHVIVNRGDGSNLHRTRQISIWGSCRHVTDPYVSEYRIRLLGIGWHGK